MSEADPIRKALEAWVHMHARADAEAALTALERERDAAVAALRQVLVPGRSIAVAQWFAARALQEIER